MRLPAVKLTATSICAALGPAVKAVTMNVTKQVLSCKLSTPTAGSTRLLFTSASIEGCTIDSSMDHCNALHFYIASGKDVAVSVQNSLGVSGGFAGLQTAAEGICVCSITKYALPCSAIKQGVNNEAMTGFEPCWRCGSSSQMPIMTWLLEITV